MSNAEQRHQGPGRQAWDEAQKTVRARNDEARRVAKQQRADDDRRHATERLKRDVRDGVYR